MTARSPLGARQLVHLAGLTYEAAVDPSAWTALLAQLRSVFDAEYCVMFAQDLRDPAVSADAQIGFETSYRRSYEDYFLLRNAYINNGLRQMRPGRICTGEESCPDDVLFRTEFYNDWMRPQGMGRGVAGVLVRTSKSISFMTLTRRHSLPQFDSREISFIERLMPHWQQAVRLHYRFAEAKALEMAASGALEAWHIGVLLLDRRGLVLTMNATAERLTGGEFGLSVGPDGVRTRDPGQTKRLRRLIAGALLGKVGDDYEAPGGTELVSAGESPRCLRVTVAPLPPASVELGGTSRARVVVFVTDALSEVQLLADVAMARYQLTPAEARAGLLLAEGHSIAEAADSLGVTRNTIKSQLRAVFDKTNVRRQSQLIRLFDELRHFVQGR